MKKIILLIVFINFSFSIIGENISLGIFYDEESYVYKNILPLYEEIFERIDCTLEFEILPTERSLRTANSGIIDGDAIRIDGISEKYTNLIKVNEAITVVNTYAYTIYGNLNFSNFEDIYDEEIVYRMGIKALEYKFKDHVSKENLNSVVSLEQMARMLKSRKVNYIIENEFAMREILEKNPEIKKAGKSLVKVPVYIYMHKKHKDKIEKLEKVIRDLKAEKKYSLLLKE